MPKVTYNGVTYECASAIKGKDYIELRDSTGAQTYRFDGVVSFSSFTITEGSWSAPDGDTTVRGTATLSSGDLIVTTDKEVGDGTMLVFKAPCDCKSVTGCLVVNDVSYDIVDSTGEIASGKGGIWGTDAMISMLLAKTDGKAFIAASGGGGGSDLSTSILVVTGAKTVTCTGSDGTTLTGTVSGGLCTFKPSAYDEYTITWADEDDTTLVVPVYVAGQYVISYSWSTSYAQGLPSILSAPVCTTELAGHVLWTNPDPQSSFKAASIPAYYWQKYKRLKILWCAGSTFEDEGDVIPYFYTEAPLDNNYYIAQCHTCFDASGMHYAYRLYSPFEDGYFWFDNVVSNDLNGSANTFCIPVKIIGYMY